MPPFFNAHCRFSEGGIYPAPTTQNPSGVGFIGAGTHRGIGRPILPPMPWFNLATAPDEDLQAIFAYLKSIPPIENQVPDAIDPPAR